MTEVPRLALVASRSSDPDPGQAQLDNGARWLFQRYCEAVQLRPDLAAAELERLPEDALIMLRDGLDDLVILIERILTVPRPERERRILAAVKGSGGDDGSGGHPSAG